MLVLVRFILVFAAFAFWAGCFFDVVRTPSEHARTLPKVLWVLVVMAVPFAGALAWVVLGRPVPAGLGSLGRGSRTGVAPDDSPEYLKALDEEIRRRGGGRRRHPSKEIDQSAIDDTIARFEEDFEADGNEPSS